MNKDVILEAIRPFAFIVGGISTAYMTLKICEWSWGPITIRVED